MQRTPETSSAEVDQELVAQLFEVTHQSALEQAGEAEARVDEIQELQREEVVELIGGEEAAVVAAPVVQAVNQKILEQHTKTMKAVEATPNATVFRREDEMAAFQEDGTGDIGIGDDAFLNLDDAKERSLHEAAHVKQQDGAPVAPLLQTGDAVIDEKPELSRGDNREDHAMDEQGGVSENQTKEYKAIVKRADAMEKFLTRMGEDGSRLREKAALTNKGFEEMHAAMISATLRNNVEKTLVM